MVILPVPWAIRKSDKWTSFSHGLKNMNGRHNGTYSRKFPPMIRKNNKWEYQRRIGN